MTTFAIGDIHGRYVALVEVLLLSGFDYSNDTLIVLGDVVDGGRDTYKVIEELLTIENCILVIGNHDIWALQWMRTGFELPAWVHQGGYATMQSYNFLWDSVPVSHVDFLKSGVPYHIDGKGRVYIHGGYDPTCPIEHNDIETLTWDRDIIEYALKGGHIDYPHVFIGHTTTQLVNGDTLPLTINNLTLLDTGGGWNGKLTIMDVDSGEYWQSTPQHPG